MREARLRAALCQPWEDHPTRGCLELEAYPESFFTIWNDETDDYTHYNNAPIAYVWTFSINFYSVDPELVNTVLLQAKEKLKENGWIIGGKGYDVATDEPTHTGRAITALYIEKS